VGGVKERGGGRGLRLGSLLGATVGHRRHAQEGDDGG
jgi:hypothetical protein